MADRVERLSLGTRLLSLLTVAGSSLAPRMAASPFGDAVILIGRKIGWVGLKSGSRTKFPPKRSVLNSREGLED
jgi:hypothetical protein